MPIIGFPNLHKLHVDEGLVFFPLFFFVAACQGAECSTGITGWLRGWCLPVKGEGKREPFTISPSSLCSAALCSSSE